jgi:nicotinamidase-related amidase
MRAEAMTGGFSVKRALLVIDVQNEYFTGKMPVTYPAGSFGRLLKAVDAARKAAMPVILIRHEATQKDAAAFIRGSHGWQIREELLKQAGYARIIDKTLPGSFTGTELEGLLREQGVDTVVICGYMSQMCCDTTARQAVHLGFSVEFLSDATGTLDVANAAGKITAEELHKAVLITQAMRFSQVLSTDEWTRSIGN